MQSSFIFLAGSVMSATGFPNNELFNVSPAANEQINRINVRPKMNLFILSPLNIFFSISDGGGFSICSLDNCSIENIISQKEAHVFKLSYS